MCDSDVTKHSCAWLKSPPAKFPLWGKRFTKHAYTWLEKWPSQFPITYPVWERDFTKHTKHAYTWLEKCLVTFQRIYPVWDRNSTKRTKHLCTWQEKWPTHISEDIPSMWFHKNTQNIRVRDGKSGLVTFTRTCRLWNSDFTNTQKHSCTWRDTWPSHISEKTYPV